MTSSAAENDESKHINARKHYCCTFGPFQKGKMQIIEPFHQNRLKNMAPLQPSLIGRAKDKYKLVQDVLTNKASRLVTLTGMPGVGKSSLLLSTLQWMEERSLLRGGQIYYNARDISCTVIFTRKLCNKLLTENNKLFKSMIPAHLDCNKQPMKVLKLIIAKLVRIEGDILLVVDNAEDLIQKDKTNFRKLISYFLQRVP